MNYGGKFWLVKPKATIFRAALLGQILVNAPELNDAVMGAFRCSKQGVVYDIQSDHLRRSAACLLTARGDEARLCLSALRQTHFIVRVTVRT